MNNNNWHEFDSEYVWHPYTQMQLSPNATAIERASGSYLYSSDGKKIFDAISSWWVTLHGHAHPVIASAIAAQATTLEQVIFAGYTHEPASVLAKKLIEKAPQGLTKVFYSDNGSTAVEAALKMCVQYWDHKGEERTTFLALENAYHGDTFGAMSASDRGTFTFPFRSLLFDVVRLPFPTPPADDSEAFSDAEQKFLDTLIKQCRENPSIAGFIYEPLLLGAGGMLTWRKQVLDEAIRIANTYSVLTIADEVLTGFGRTGYFFASESAGSSPDIMTLSKGITGGFLPLGVTLCSKKIYDAFLSNDRKKTFFHGHSYTGNPISCAAAVASLSIFENEPVAERINTINAVHNERMTALGNKHNATVRILGTMAAIEPKDSTGYLNTLSLAI
ncbi:MAG TPA: adenosylmethionine--8-amino-7-oxononanoate transaminase [Candidatus Kapabacteria bacterium]